VIVLPLIEPICTNRMQGEDLPFFRLRAQDVAVAGRPAEVFDQGCMRMAHPPTPIGESYCAVDRSPWEALT
jgi:hypothetical protein